MSDEELETLPNIVIDGGSGSFKIGLAGDEVPQDIFPAIIGSLRHTDSKVLEDTLPKKLVGNEITASTQELNSISLNYPIQNGIVTDWDGLELLLAHSFQQLRVDPEEHAVLMSDPPLNPQANNALMSELLFETFNVPAFHLEDSSRLNLYAAGRHYGIMIDIGDGVTSVVPFYESHCFKGGIQRQDFGGRDLTYFLQRLLHEKGYSFTTSSELEQVREMKESIGYVSPTFEANSIPQGESLMNNPYTLPDGNKVAFEERERSLIPEALFNPSLAGFPYLKGLPDLITSCLSMCERDTRADIYCGFFINGGCCLFPGFQERLTEELKKRLPSTRRSYVHRSTPGVLSTWIGGSILGSLSMFQGMLSSKQDYYENGPFRVNRQRAHP